MAKAFTIVAVERFLLVALLAAFAKCKERVLLVLALSNLSPRLAPRWVDPWKWDFGLLFLLTMILLSKASNFHSLCGNWSKCSLSHPSSGHSLAIPSSKQCGRVGILRLSQCGSGQGL